MNRFLKISHFYQETMGKPWETLPITLPIRVEVSSAGTVIEKTIKTSTPWLITGGYVVILHWKTQSYTS